MSPDQTGNFNQNVADCIRASHSVGGDTFYNVCTGAHYWVPWGIGGLAWRHRRHHCGSRHRRCCHSDCRCVGNVKANLEDYPRRVARGLP